jgi:hypothetical protein
VNTIQTILSSPANVLLLVAGLLLVFLAAAGRVVGKINPGKGGRIFAGISGPVLIVGGLLLHPVSSATTNQGPTGSGSTSGTGTGPAVNPVNPNPPTAFHVIEAILRADPSDYTGPKPARIQFHGRISAVGGSGTVSFRFIRSDGASAPVQTVTFDGPGSKDVATEWQLSGDYQGWEAIKTIDPQALESEHATFKVQIR